MPALLLSLLPALAFPAPALLAQADLLPEPPAPTAAAHLAFDNGGQRVPLHVDGRHFGIRFADGVDAAAARAVLAALPGVDPASAADAPVAPGRTTVVAMQPVPTADAALALAEQFRAHPEIVAASPRLWAVPWNDPYFLTEDVLVRWRPGAPAADRERLTAGLRRSGTLAYAENPGEVWTVPSDRDPLAVAQGIAASGLAEFAIPDFQLLRVTYDGAPDVPGALAALAGTNDPLYGDQWHLESVGQNGAGVDEDVDVEGAWNVTRGDPAVVLAVVDEGIELAHPDLNLVQGTDVLDNDNDPRAEDSFFGLFQENHSTSVSGVAAARGNNALGVSGVAQECRVMPIRFLSANLFNGPTVQDEADAFNFACQNGASAINNSWGPLFGAPLPASTKAAIDDCNDHGRNGLGAVVFFAAGNSDSNNSNNGYASYEGVIGVSACTDQGVKAGYSSFGPSVDVCAPSNGGNNGITTTDRLGGKGYSNGDYTSTFGGTSSASPCAAGVLLLMLSANPSLTRLEAIALLQGTAEKIDAAGGGYDVFGHSDLYGWGRVNAEQAVLAATAPLPVDVITLTGDTQGPAGGTVNYQFSNAPQGQPYRVLGSESAGGSIVRNQLFDVGTPWTVLATGTTSATGTGAFSLTLPAGSAGQTLHLEVGAWDGMSLVDSNDVAVTVQ